MKQKNEYSNGRELKFINTPTHFRYEQKYELEKNVYGHCVFSHFRVITICTDKIIIETHVQHAWIQRDSKRKEFIEKSLLTNELNVRFWDAGYNRWEFTYNFEKSLDINKIFKFLNILEEAFGERLNAQVLREIIEYYNLTNLNHVYSNFDELIKEGNFEKALEEAKNAQEHMHGLYPDALFKLGNMCEEHKNFIDAFKAYENIPHECVYFSKAQKQMGHIACYEIIPKIQEAIDCATNKELKEQFREDYEKFLEKGVTSIIATKDYQLINQVYQDLLFKKMNNKPLFDFTNKSHEKMIFDLGCYIHNQNLKIERLEEENNALNKKVIELESKQDDEYLTTKKLGFF